MLYTRKGDGGTTKTFGCDQRISKSSSVAEALGSLDEINSFLGLVKVEAEKPSTSSTTLGTSRSGQTNKLLPGTDMRTSVFIQAIQESLFIIQAEVAGFPKPLGADKVRLLETVTDAIEKELPPIKTFFISGGTELAALFDVSRTIARRAERRVVAVVDEGHVKVSPETLGYLNRLSSILYALARFANHEAGITESAPSYK